MPDAEFAPDPKPTSLGLLARATAGMGRVATTGLALLSISLCMSAVGPVADWMAKQRAGTTEGLRAFQWEPGAATAPACVGAACGMAPLPLRSTRQVGAAGSVTVTARMLWPAPIVIEASPGTHLVAVGARDGLHPVVEREEDEQAEDDPALDTRPVLLAHEVQKDGSSRPIRVPVEGFVSAWAPAGADAGAEPLTPWTRPVDTQRNEYSQLAAIQRKEQWRALKLRSLQFQPMPTVVEAEVLRAALLEPIQVGHAFAFDWQADGVLQGQQSQLTPSRGALGVVTQVQERGQYLRLKLQIPRTSPYARAHWLLSRLDALAPGATPLPDHVQALFFKPDEMLGSTPGWGLLERLFFKLPVGEVMRVPAASLDPGCADRAEPPRSCVWVVLQGVAVPVQVKVLALPDGDFSLEERAVFAGKALRPADWAALPHEFRRAYGSPSVPGRKPSRTLLDPRTAALLAPQPWLRAGLPVSVAGRTAGAAP